MPHRQLAGDPGPGDEGRRSPGGLTRAQAGILRTLSQAGARHRAQDQPGAPSQLAVDFARFGSGVEQQLSLGHWGERFAPPEDYQSLSGTAAELSGNIVGALPLAFATGAGVTYGLARGAGALALRSRAAMQGGQAALQASRTARQAGNAAEASRLLTQASQSSATAARMQRASDSLRWLSARPAAEQTFWRSRVQGAVQNIVQGAAFSAVAGGLWDLDEAEQRSERLINEFGVGVAGDAILGLLLTKRIPNAEQIIRNMAASDNSSTRTLGEYILSAGGDFDHPAGLLMAPEPTVRPMGPPAPGAQGPGFEVTSGGVARRRGEAYPIDQEMDFVFGGRADLDAGTDSPFREIAHIPEAAALRARPEPSAPGPRTLQEDISDFGASQLGEFSEIRTPDGPQALRATEPRASDPEAPDVRSRHAEAIQALPAGARRVLDDVMAAGTPQEAFTAASNLGTIRLQPEEQAVAETVVRETVESLGPARASMTGARPEPVRAPRRAPEPEAVPTPAEAALESPAAKEAPDASASEATPRPVETEAPPAEATTPREVSGPSGREQPAIFSDGTEVRTRYRLVPADDLVPSHTDTGQPNPDYTLGAQGRTREAGVYRQQVQEMESGWDPRRGNDPSTSVMEGPPGVTSGGQGVWGHGRLRAQLNLARTRGPRYEQNVQHLIENAQQYGMTPDEVRAAFSEKPHVLVREVLDDTNDAARMRELNRLSDRPSTATMDPVDEGAARAASLREAPQSLSYLQESLTDEQTVRAFLDTATGSRFIRQLVSDGVISGAEAPRYMDATGGVTQDGKNLIESMVQVAAIGDPAVVRTSPADVRRKLDTSYPAIIRTQGTEGWDVSPRLREALEILTEYRTMRNQGDQPVKDLTQFFDERSRQGTMFERPREYSERAQTLARAIDGEMSKTELRAAFDKIGREAAIARQNLGQNDFFVSEPRTMDEVFDDAFGVPKRIQDSKVNPCQ